MYILYIVQVRSPRIYVKSISLPSRRHNNNAINWLRAAEENNNDNK